MFSSVLMVELHFFFSSFSCSSNCEVIVKISGAGSGFVSQDLYLHGFFSVSIKLPADYTAGVVVAFDEEIKLELEDGDAVNVCD